MIPVADSELPFALSQLDLHAEGPIFLQSNLRNYGLAGDAPNSVRLWRNADWTGFVGVTVSGMIEPQMRDASDRDWQSLASAMAGVQLSEIIGEANQAIRLRDELRLSHVPLTLNDNEPSFGLDLANLVMPDCDGLVLRPLQCKDRQLLLAWRAAYRIDILGDTAEMAKSAAGPEVEEMLSVNSHRILWQGGEQVSMAGINAHIPGQVQIGGVYTPPEWRGRGFARRAVALLLDEKRSEGIMRAFLFAASEQAARAYIALGFQPEGRVRMIFFKDKVTIKP